MGWLIAALSIALLLLIPLGVCISYDDEGGRINLIAGPFRVLLYPGKNRPEKKDNKTAEKTSSKTQGTSPKRNRGSISDFYPFIRLVLDFLCDFRRKLRVDMFRLRIILAGGDPADLTQNYGKAWAATAALWPCLNRVFVIKKQDVDVQCDFIGEKSSICARLDLTITVGRLLSLVFYHGTKVLKEFFVFRKKRNGGIV